MATKWLELVKGIAPNITRVAYIFNPNTAPLLYARAVETAAPSLSIKLFAAEVGNADEMEGVIEQFAREPDSALLVLPDLFTATNRQSIIALAARHRLPAVYPFRYFVASGGLMSYGLRRSRHTGRRHPMSLASSRVKIPVTCRYRPRPRTSW